MTRGPRLPALSRLVPMLLLALVTACASAPRPGGLGEAAEEKPPPERIASSRSIVRITPPGGPGDLASVATVSQTLSRAFAKYGEKTRFSQIEGTTLLLTALPAEGVAELHEQPDVAGVYVDYIEEAYLGDSIPIVAAPGAWPAGNGAGQTVVVLDSGVDGDHAFYEDRIVAEACFSSTSEADQATSLCPQGGEEEAGSDSARMCTGLPGCDHGTHVAGIVGGANGNDGGQTLNGVAPGVDLIPIQVFSRFDSSVVCKGSPPCIRTYISDQIAALVRVRDLLRHQHPIAAVNMSLGGGRSSGHCDDDPRKEVIDDLRAAGIATVIATGNDRASSGIGFPACISSAVAVGATTDGDEIATSFSNSGLAMDLLAPGQGIRSSIPGGGFGPKSGTSMATPHVSGAWAVLKSQHPDATVQQIEDRLKQGGSGNKILDTRNGITATRIDVAAAAAIPGGDDDSVPVPVPEPEPEPECDRWWCSFWPW